MRPSTTMNDPTLETEGRLSELSIIIEDYDSPKKIEEIAPERKQSIGEILDKAEKRIHELQQIIEEHQAIIKKLKKMEKQWSPE